jgi:serine/threonine protein kinase
MRKLTLTFGEWQLDEAAPLGKAGGFGSVFSGLGADGTAVAIKLINLEAGDAAKRELEFAKAFAGRRTQYIIPIVDYGIDNITKKSCIVMARAEGSLRDAIAKTSIEQTEAINIIGQIAKGLLEAEDWIHRDLKPENILQLNGIWKIADFGIARLAEATTATRTLKNALSPPYAAREQWRGITATHATDIYALGCIAVELFTGRLAFVGPDVEDFARQHQSDLPGIENVPPYLRSLLFRMLAKPMVARPSAEKVIADLNHYKAHPQGGGPGANRLTAVSAAVAEQTARAQAMELAKLARLEQRRVLRDHAHGVMLGIAERLFAEIAQHAPEAKVSKKPEGHGHIYEATLGH